MLTDKEKEYSQGYLNYYSGRAPNMSQNKQKIDDFVFGDETTQRALLKDFITNILLPQIQVNKTSLENSIAQITEQVTELQTYIAE